MDRNASEKDTRVVDPGGGQSSSTPTGHIMVDGPPVSPSWVLAFSGHPLTSKGPLMDIHISGVRPLLVKESRSCFGGPTGDHAIHVTM